jgi:hypothetical protein
MLDPAAAFSLAGLLAMAAWLALIISLFFRPLRPAAWTAAQFVVPAILAVAYVLLIWSGRAAFDAGGFGSITEVRALFAVDSALAAGWLHYLAFDLFIGGWIARDAAARNIAPLLVLPCLPLTFLFGPSGLLLYFVLRAVRRAQPVEASQ